MSNPSELSQQLGGLAEPTQPIPSSSSRNTTVITTHKGVSP
jgi:hypothetical protein